MKTRKQGLTLIELVAAVTVFALLAALLMAAVNAALANWRNARTRAELSARGMALLDIIEADLHAAVEVGADRDGDAAEETLLRIPPDTEIYYEARDFALWRDVATNGTWQSTNVLAAGVRGVEFLPAGLEAVDVRLSLFPQELHAGVVNMNAQDADEWLARHTVHVSRRVHVPNQLAARRPDNRLKIPPRTVVLSGTVWGDADGWRIQDAAQNGNAYTLEVPAFYPRIIQPRLLSENDNEHTGAFSPAWRVWHPGTPTNGLDFAWVSNDAAERVTLRGRVLRSDIPGRGVPRIQVFLEDSGRTARTDNEGWFVFRVSELESHEVTLGGSPSPWGGRQEGGNGVFPNFELEWTPPVITLGGVFHNFMGASPTLHLNGVDGSHPVPATVVNSDGWHTVESTLLFDWRGTVTAALPGGVFIMPANGYTVGPLRESRNDLDFTAYPNESDRVYIEGHTLSRLNGTETEALPGVALLLLSEGGFFQTVSDANGYYFFHLGAGFTGLLVPAVPPGLSQVSTPFFLPPGVLLNSPGAPVRQDFTLFPADTQLVTLSGRLFPGNEGAAPPMFTNLAALAEYPVLFLTETNAPSHAEFPVVHTFSDGTYTNRVVAPWTGVVLPATGNLINADQVRVSHAPDPGDPETTTNLVANLPTGLFRTNNLAPAFAPPAHIFTGLGVSTNHVHFTATNSVPAGVVKE